MKTTIISFVAIIMICMTAMSFTNKADKKNALLIQVSDNQITSTVLSSRNVSPDLCDGNDE